MPKDNTFSRFFGRSSDLKLVSALEKGDYVGHPFRGNQWATSTGASRGATGSDVDDFELEFNENSTLEDLGVETIDDETATKIGKELRARLDAFKSAGGTISQILQTDQELNEAERSVAAQTDGLDLSDTTKEHVKGIQMTKNAINDFGGEWMNFTAVKVAKTQGGEVAGAVSYIARPTMPLGFEELDSGGRISMEVMGSMQNVRGAGTAMFVEVLRHAESYDAGLGLIPLDEQAMDFWLNLGFSDAIEGSLSMTADSVKKILKETL
jgi:hypothetical protein